MIRLKFLSILQRLFFVFLIVFTSSPWSVYSKETLNIAVLITSGEQRSIMSSLLNRFSKQNSDVDVNLIMLPDAEFKIELNKWLNAGHGPDIINWQAGERLYQYIRKNKIKSIDSIWQKHHLSKVFNQSAQSAVTLKNDIYGIPFSYYQWGFYYRKSTFERYNLTPPKTWTEFLYVCEVLKRNGITPITLGNKYQWPSAAWFDYINLRQNGLTFHAQLLRGEIPFSDPKVVTVFKYWKQLLDKQYFVEQSDIWKWDEAMPFLYHNLAGMTLIGNFFSGKMPEALKDDFSFFRFPIINTDIALYEEAPLDVFMVPNYTEINSTVERFLLFVASSEFQASFNNELGMISPNLNAAENTDQFSLLGKQLLNEAEGLSQFFDRDTNSGMSNEAITIFSQFIADKNITTAINKLEQARKLHLNKQKLH